MKRIVIFFVLISTLLLSACDAVPSNSVRFRRAFENLQAQECLYYRTESYKEKDDGTLELRLVCQEWQCADGFYREYSDDGTAYLNYKGRNWRREAGSKGALQPIKWDESPSDWWKRQEAVNYLPGAKFRTEDGLLLMEQYEDHGSANCTGNRQETTRTFYLDESGNIARMTARSVTYNGREIDPEKIRSVNVYEYYFQPISPEEVQEKIQQVYNTVPKC